MPSANPDYEVVFDGRQFDPLCLQTPHVGQCGHLAVQRQDFQACTGIVVGDEAVEESGTA